ncbi:MAG: NFACT family protein [Acidobacteria bacterium]|jgi:predicted ribosome quality control (RQC) complex YloA/Tae2 family protein|nr:NFACT family protein [Acidobacteriota bacterium]
MNAFDARALAPLLDAALRGRFIKNISAPDPFFLGLAFSAEETLGLSCRPEAFHAGLCSWAWPEVQAPEVLRTHLKGARVERVEAVDGEPILRIVLSGGAAFVCEALGRSANLLLLSKEGVALWAARKFKGQFRTGAPGETWALPPPRGSSSQPPPTIAEPGRYLREEGPQALRAGLIEAGRRRAGGELAKRAKVLKRRREAVTQERAEGQSWMELEASGRALLALGNLDRRGLGQADVVDYGAVPPKAASVALDPALSLKENASRFFRLAKRGKSRMEKTAAILAAIARDEEALALEREALAREENLGRLFPKAARTSSAKQRVKAADKLPKGVVRLELPRGFAGYAGKTALANDFVTFRIGRGEDFWFHAADYPGCHVVVRNPSRLEDCPQDVAQAAALYAASHSGASRGGRVAVIFARCKNLRRVPRSPGLVSMAHARTLDVELKGRG